MGLTDLDGSVAAGFGMVTEPRLASPPPRSAHDYCPARYQRLTRGGVPRADCYASGHEPLKAVKADKPTLRT